MLGGKMKSLFVIKFGGSLTKNPIAQNKFIKEISQISNRQNIVLVHGGGPEINYFLEKFQIKTKFINGLRFTDKAVMDIVELALSAKVNKTLVSQLLKNRVKAVGISGKDGASVICSQLKALGFVGNPVKVNKKLIEVLLKNNFLPVMSPVSIDKNGNTVNVNADNFAAAIAVAFKADKLIFLTDVKGVLDKNKNILKQIKVKEIDALIKNQVITGGMIPKIKSCAASVNKGVKEVCIADGINGLKNLKGTVVKK
jgi:acetylglutamate kinase